MFAFFPIKVGAEIPFTLESIGAENVGGYSYVSLALDKTGSPRLAFNTGGGFPHRLMYAEKIGKAWAIEMADPTQQLVLFTSLALDSSGDPHISYQGSSGGLLYATRSGGVWAVETADRIGNTGYHTSLAIDSQDNPHISYCRFTDDEDNEVEDLFYATKFDGLWIQEVVDQAASAYTSLELDASGNPCISYATAHGDEGDGSSDVGTVKFARKEGGIWTKEVVARADGAYTSLAIDSNGNPHISYAFRDADNVDHVMYALKSGDVWTTEIVGGFGVETSIDLDAKNQPWISYRDGTASSILKLATKQYGIWTIQTVDANEPTGVNPSIVLDSQDLPWIGYGSPSAADIKVAIPNVGAVGVEPFVAENSFVGSPFPNPSRGTISLAIRIPSTESVRLTLFDVGGRMISRIPGHELTGGSRVVTWSPKNVESGVYFLRVESSSGIQETRQVTVIR